MSSTTDLAVEQFGLWGGTFLRPPTNTRVSAAPSAGAGQELGRLHILVEAADGSRIAAALYDRLLSAIELTYYAQQGDVAEALDAALRAASGLLFQRNLRADGAHQVAAGLQAVAIADGQVTIAQLGPASLCGVLGGRPFLLPADSPWLSPPAAAAAPEPSVPAGLRREAAPRLYRAALEAGDFLALTTSNLAQALPVWDLLPLLAKGPEEVRSRLAPLGLARDWSAIVVGDATSAAADLPADPATLVELEEIVLAPAAEALAQSAEAVPPPEESDESFEPAEWEDEAPPAAPEGADEPVLAEPAAPLDEEKPATDDEEPWEDAPWEGADEEAWAASDAGEPAAAEELPAGAPSPGPALPRVDLAPLADSLSRRFSRLVTKVEDVLVNVLPKKVPQRPSPAPRPGPRISFGGRILVLLAMAIPLVMLGAVIMTRVQYEKARRDQFGDIQARAQSLYDQATTSGNLAATRQGLYDALATTEEGLSITPGDEMLLSLKRRVEHQLDQINVVERIYTFYRLTDLDEGAVGSGDASRIVVEGIDLYVLHRGSDRVARYLMNDVGDALQPVGSDPTLLRRGDLVGGARVGDLVDMAWMRAGGQRTLDTFVMLDRTGTMYAYDPQVGIEALPVADADTWLKPEAIGGYFGNLYVLDPLLNAILKYVPTDNAYTSPPTAYLNPALGIDLTGAVDMAVDGNMYVLFANGEVAKFFEGERVPFSMEGLPSPMRSPSAIFVSGEQEPDAAGYVYVADTGNQRVVQFDKNGNYIRQLKAKLDGQEMEGLRGLWVDEESERILLVSDDALWYAKLPGLAAR